MPAGDYPAGAGPAGFDPVSDPLARRVFRGPAAMAYDGASRDWPLTPQNNYRSVHPVDQMMALSVLVRKGSIASAPIVGSTLHEIAYLNEKLEGDVADRVKTSEPAATLLKGGRAAIKQIQVERTRSGFKTVVSYVNLVTGNKRDVSYYS